MSSKKLQSEISKDDPSSIYWHNVKVLIVYCLVFTISYFFYNMSWMIIEGKTPFKKIIFLFIVSILLTGITLLVTSFIGVKLTGV